MRKEIVICAALSLAILNLSRAIAADTPSDTNCTMDKPPCKTAADTKLTNTDCLNILNGLNGLDGYSVTINEGKPNESSYIRAYKFANADLRITIQRDLSVLQGVQKDIESARQHIFGELSKDGADIPPGSPAFTDYNKQVQALGAAECTVRLVPIKAADLKLDVNEIPGTVLSALDKILDK